ncbi:response regulator transcription factor [Dictyobacter aurantiacus]|uniref:Response regulatory domain-containing protein n=1 Tax=Dictyobacter aurantiacus TaxID=1936993 RepID=A0A401ZCN2_9CHLR|nr:response regulator transcription factor [Dictyobacter aurantiacus]GCE04634.1 hypothetical protein KDAU_19630 [Dictyobacter aurantiacus]
MAAKVPILLVNSNQRNLQLLMDVLDKEGYDAIAAHDYPTFDQAIIQQPAPKGALVDIAGFDSEIWPRCEQLRAAKIPFLVISPRLSAAVQQASLTHGARGVMVKPLIIKEFMGIIQSLLEE